MGTNTVEPLYNGHSECRDSQRGPNGVHYREVPLYMLSTAQSKSAQGATEESPTCVALKVVPDTNGIQSIVLKKVS